MPGRGAPALPDQDRKGGLGSRSEQGAGTPSTLSSFFPVALSRSHCSQFKLLVGSGVSELQGLSTLLSFLIPTKGTSVRAFPHPCTLLVCLSISAGFICPFLLICLSLLVCLFISARSISVSSVCPSLVCLSISDDLSIHLCQIYLSVSAGLCLFLLVYVLLCWICPSLLGLSVHL